MAPTTTSRPGRTLLWLLAIAAVLFGSLAAGTVWSNAQWFPKLALDLEGGTEFVLKAVPQEGTSGTITSTTMNDALKIIRQRVDGNGIAESEISLSGQDKIIVSLPGKNIDENVKKSIRDSAALEFRQVLQILPPGSGKPQISTAPTSPGGKSGAVASSGASGVPQAPAGQSAATASAAKSDGMPIPRALLKPVAATAKAELQAPSQPPVPTGGGTVSPQNDLPAQAPDGSAAQDTLDPETAKALTSTDCSTPQGRQAAQERPNNPKKTFLACGDDGATYVLDKVEVFGKDIDKATATIATNSQGQQTGQWVVNLSFNSKGASDFGKVTSRLAAISEEDVKNQFAIVLDNLVISAPRTNEAITGGSAQISGSFTQESAQALANQLQFGALPLSFKVETENEISATLGEEQLRNGLLAGLIGMILVFVYSLFQYRALGFVTILSLLVAGAITYGCVAWLSWRQGLRLSLPGVAGLIISIGVTADSFIVLFERIRDEIRDGRSLPSAVEMGWLRARRTLLISDGISLLAAVVLYLLAVGGVRGFAFMLGLSTVVDVLITFMFTKPLVTYVSRMRYFSQGRKFSGFDAEHLGRNVAYTGRGTTRPVGGRARDYGQANRGLSIAERKSGIRTKESQQAADGAFTMGRND